jgi:hypothetical protein
VSPGACESAMLATILAMRYFPSIIERL